MRPSIIALCLSLTSTIAVADGTSAQRPPTPPASNAKTPSTPAIPSTPSTNLAPIDLTTIPEQCRTIAKQVSSPNLATALSARISLANCLADVKLAPLVLCDCEDSILAIDEAMKQSVELLDEVIAGATDDPTRIVAEQAKAELYTNVTVRMLGTLPHAGTTEASIAMHVARKDILESLLARWRGNAAASYEKIVAIVKATPKLETNPVVATALRTAKDRLRLHVATATPPPAPPSSSEAPPPDEPPKVEAEETLR